MSHKVNKAIKKRWYALMGNQKVKRKFLIFTLSIIWLLSAERAFSQTENTPNIQPGNGHQSYTAIIEEVIHTEHQGYTSVKFRVHWKGSYIIVPNSIQKVEKGVGDQLKFLVMWHDLDTKNGSKKLLSFASIE